jgi:hypothetical protein
MSHEQHDMGCYDVHGHLSYDKGLPTYHASNALKDTPGPTQEAELERKAALMF